MRIDDFSSASNHKRPESESRSKTDFRIPSASDGVVEDIVQLTLGHDGIWKVNAASHAETPVMRASQSFSEAFPRVSRLYHSWLRVYSPEGIARALEPSTGMLVDLYA